MLGDKMLGELFGSPIQVIWGFAIFMKANVRENILRNMTTKWID